jgi:xyloglucan:xyloglucosyl transferase
MASSCWQRHLVVVVVVAAALMIMPMATTAAALEDDVGYAGSVGFDEGFSPLFGEANMERSADGRGVRLTLNRYSGSGFISKHYYHHGFFSADVTLPKDHTAGVVVAFYVCQSSIRPEYIFFTSFFCLQN